MTVSSRRVLRCAALAVVLTVSVFHRAECQILIPSVTQSLLQTVGNIGKMTIDLFCKPILVLGGGGGGGVPPNILARALRTRMNAARSRHRTRARLAIGRRWMANVLRRRMAYGLRRPMVNGLRRPMANVLRRPMSRTHRRCVY